MCNSRGHGTANQPKRTFPPYHAGHFPSKGCKFKFWCGGRFPAVYTTKLREDRGKEQAFPSLKAVLPPKALLSFIFPLPTI